MKALVHLGALEAADGLDDGGTAAAGVTGLFLLAQALRDDLERAAADGRRGGGRRDRHGRRPSASRATLPGVRPAPGAHRRAS